MNPSHDNLAHQPATDTGVDNVVEIRDGESWNGLVDQPLPADIEQVVPERLSLLVQIRRARFASRGSRTGAGGWRDPHRWAAVSVVLGAVLIVVAGAIELLGR